VAEDCDLQDPIVISGCGWITPYAAGSIEGVLAAKRPEAVCAEGYWPISDDQVPVDAVPEFERTPELKQDRGARVAAMALHLARSDAGFAPEDAGRDACTTPGGWDGTRTGLILGCGLAGQMGMIQFANEVRAQSPRFVSPIHFPQTVGNYIAGALSRAFDLRGPNLTLAGGIGSGLDAVAEAARIIRAGDADLIFAGGVEVLSPELARTFEGDDLPLSEGACLLVIERRSRAESRGRRILAALCPEKPARDDPLETDIISAARHDLKNAITIATWIGRCHGALGAAAIAAAIGAGRGLAVPKDGHADPVIIAKSEAPHHARIVAEAHNVSLFLNIDQAG
jgi:3-oxoacyl-(acyl-carrier-protein) synthase